ncbi:nicotinate dehydrogenase FAD-subunit [bacterium BMS3Abin02]|nr:nicotinate dehydrogenase FAD-subunit [bacterium BMS3Abin02]
MFTEYLRPESVEEAFRTLQELGENARLVGGGTDLIVHPPADVTTLVDLSHTGLGRIDADDTGFHIGASTTLTDVLDYPPFADIWSGVLPAMLSQVASPLHRNAASIGGHLARGRLSDVVPVLLAIDAKISFYDGGHHQLPLTDFYSTRKNRTRLIVTEVHLDRDFASAAFRKFARTTYDLAILNAACAVRVEDDAVSWARVVVGERPTLAVELSEASSVLVGRSLDTETIGRTANKAMQTVEVRSDPRASAGYRRHLTEVLVRRCLTEVAGEKVYA